MAAAHEVVVLGYCQQTVTRHNTVQATVTLIRSYMLRQLAAACETATYCDSHEV